MGIMGPSSDSLISVIIPLYNKERSIYRAISSVLSQKDVRIEVIVVDDGSTDGSKEVIQPFTDQIILIEQENRGPSAARNRGVAHSHGEYLAILDADDELLPGSLHAHLECRRHYQGTKVTLSSYKVVCPDGRVYSELLYTRVERLQHRDCCYYTKTFHAELIVGANP